ncbi:DUF3606 domain-containing protein [Pedobacter sp. AW31-3R]|uniref:DUF3606 domain-containing protein n=1 Tax=Pedobacter sp. AW31-3R TaxID=3445781 RepID=UPI003FA01F26
MNNNLSFRKLQQNKINITEKYEIHYWSKKLGISNDDLIEAVKSVGTSLNEVKKYLKKGSTC